jgi:phosphoglycolate phosphatase
MMSVPRAVIFDWDNTLVDSWSTIHEARVRHSLREAFPALFGERWDEARKLYLDHFTAIHLERMAPIAGVPELLDEIKSARLYTAVLSNKTGAILRREADHLGWSGYFEHLVGAGDASADKPDPAAMALALEGSLHRGEEVWYVGDTALDMECAARAGCVGVLLGSFDVRDQGFARFPPQRRFQSVVELSRGLRGEPVPSSSESS